MSVRPDARRGRAKLLSGVLSIFSTFLGVAMTRASSIGSTAGRLEAEWVCG